MNNAAILEIRNSFQENEINQNAHVDVNNFDILERGGNGTYFKTH